MSVHVLIPARLASTRLPDKPLADIAGVPMVVRVAQRVARCIPAERVVVAADDARVVAACEFWGVRALLTDANHATGTDRLAQACDLLALPDDALVVNVQGDEPLIDPNLVQAVGDLLALQSAASMSTAAHPIEDVASFRNPNVVKVVLDRQGYAMYFSRAPIPWPRDSQALAPPAPGTALRHIGIYGYRAGFLRAYPHLPPCVTEQTESLEQLRALYHGHRIAVCVWPSAPGAGVDTPEDLMRVRQWYEQHPALSA